MDINQYCIPQGSKQQCNNCQLINGKLYIGNYAFPNCPCTQWKQIASWPGTNNTPVYEVVAMPLDSFAPVLLLAVSAVVLIKRKKLKIV